MGWLAAAYALEALIAAGAPIALVVWLRRRLRIGYALVGIGALTFVASQVVHLPLNWLLARFLPTAGSGLALTAAVLGLSAGFCEEVARWVVIRFVRRDVRHTEPALMLGAGHGGIEALVVAVFAVLASVNTIALDRFDPVQLGLTRDQQVAAVAQIALLRQLPVAMPLLGALERLMVLPFHLAATLIVTRAVARGRPAWLLGAIVFHAMLDAPMAWLSWHHGPIAAELWIGAMGVASLVVLWLLGRQLRRPAAQVVDDSAPTGAPIELRLASKTYRGGVRALRETSLVIERGTRTCLLGPNGAGKTTTIRLLTGGLAPSSGHAWLFGRASGDDDFLESKRRLGFVPQQPGMYDDLTVRSWLELVRDVYGRGDPTAIAARLGLDDLLDRPMARLSGGQKRRVAIAAAVLAEPDLVILDEPTAGLDPVAAREVLDFLHRLAPSHTILLCTHDLDEAEELCDRVVVMRDGRVAVHEAIEALRGRMVPQLALRAAGDGDALREALVVLGKTPDESEGDLVVTVADPAKDAPALLRALLDKGVDVMECRVVRPSLEALFLDIVGKPAESEPDAPAAAPLEEPVPPPVPLADLWAPVTRRLLAKEWRQLRASGGAFWTSLLLPVFFLGLAPQGLIGAAMGAKPEHDPTLPSWGMIHEIGMDPRRMVVAMLPLFITVAALAAPTALITHSILSERESRTLDLLVALPVRVQQVVAAKLFCVVAFATSICGVFLVGLGVELVVLGLATVGEVAALLVMLACALAHATATALLVALLAKDFRTANNLAGVIIAPAIFVVLGVVAVTPGGPIRALVLATLFAVAALALGRVALRSATFERLLP